jgi:hypothetical protein
MNKNALSIENKGGDILGLRIIMETPLNSGNFYIQYEFTGNNWKRNAAAYLPYYMGRRDIRLQTLHHFTSSYDIETGQKYNVGNIWLENIYIRPHHLN